MNASTIGGDGRDTSRQAMPIIQAEIEIVDRATESIRYLEHGWPTDLCRWHAHEEYELHLIVRTRGKAFVGDYIGEFSPGSLFLTGPNLPHNWITHDIKTPPVEVRDMLVQFNNKSLRGLIAAFPEFSELWPMLDMSKSGIEFIGFDPTEAQSRMAGIRDTHGVDRIIAFLSFLNAINAHGSKKALSVLQPPLPNRNSRQARIGKVIDHIVNHYTDEISLEEAARMAGMSPSTFSRNFQTATGNKFVEFVNRVRVGQACGMIYATDEQISGICYKAGFQNLANFNRQFLKMKGMTPTEYRRVARRELVSAPAESGRAVR